jgi:hypothetical protein
MIAGRRRTGRGTGWHYLVANGPWSEWQVGLDGHVVPEKRKRHWDKLSDEFAIE